MDWEERWNEAYSHGPVRVLVADRRTLREPLLIPCAKTNERSAWFLSPAAVKSYERTNQALIRELLDEEDPNGA